MHLDNGVIRIGIDTAHHGGAITYLALSGSGENLVNVSDHGREIQQSYYAGRARDRRAEGQSAAWSPWPWNPVQAGDAFGNESPVLDSRVGENSLYVKTLPLLWDMNNARAECCMETWISLEANVAHVRNRLTVQRTDDTWEAVACHQELPAVYVISKLSRIVTYVGDEPFTQGALTEIVNQGPPWEYWGAGAPKPELAGQTEKWAAVVNADGWGVGIFSPRADVFAGGLHGAPGGGSRDMSTCYVAPLESATLGKDTVYDYDYDLVLGTVEQIREHARQHAGLE